ncbi:ABC transporter ATP-binding protein [Jiangella mangrovi]|uniref:Oligopeptide/dipeptide ABC transporter ATP-binding protein n=1 Tax=Jiangella mangrovi TaxID=1524084 RepID=A0A7W9GXP0_9ACTN|nr:ABC transporter ATP-binding protein [Jiangella mangrovi]MBB5791679.1 oligopeptide/dipeptide ABC transporter ATP-binding protein [Jiangella mangrovi]
MTVSTRIQPHHVDDGGGASTSTLAISDLTVRFPQRYGDVAVLDGVGLSIGPGESLAIVGESGCGKSLLGLAAANMLPPTAEVGGQVLFQGRDLYRLRGRERRAVRGAGIGIVYQDALTSLNPGMSIGAQLRQVCRLGSPYTPSELLDAVGLPDARILKAKPYQLSGGQRQRVLIALALAREPKLLIADEPTTALDVTVEAKIIELLQRLQAELDFALLFISHDLAIVSQLCHRVAVMYGGQLVETGPTDEILASPHHPYTAGLLAASSSLDEGHATLATIPGFVHPPTEFPSGCRFRDRCSHAQDDCAVRPVLTDGPRRLACHHPLTHQVGGAR